MSLKGKITIAVLFSGSLDLMKAGYIRVFYSLLERKGIDADQWLASANLSLDQLDQQLTLPQERTDYLSLQAIQLTGDPGLGLKLGQQLNVNTHGILGYTLMSSQTIEQALNHLLKYYKIQAPSIQLSATTNEHSCLVECQTETADPRVQTFTTEALLSSIYTTARFLVNDDLPGSAVELSYDRPAHADLYHQHFPIPVSFNKPKNCLIFDRSALQLPLPTANESTAEIFQKQCEQQLLEMGYQIDLVNNIRTLLLKQPQHFASFNEVAEQLNMSGRTLRRKLALSGTSYQEILNSVRRQLAEEYLRTTDMKIADIGYLIGFNDPSNFRRAFIEWSGLSPTEYRTQHQ